MTNENNELKMIVDNYIREFEKLKNILIEKDIIINNYDAENLEIKNQININYDIYNKNVSELHETCENFQRNNNELIKSNTKLNLDKETIRRNIMEKEMCE